MGDVRSMIISPFIAEIRSASTQLASARTQSGTFQDLLGEGLGGEAQNSSQIFDFSELGMLGSGQQSLDAQPPPNASRVAELKATPAATPSPPDRDGHAQQPPTPTVEVSDTHKLAASTLSPGWALFNSTGDVDSHVVVQAAVDAPPQSPGSLASLGALDTLGPPDAANFPIPEQYGTVTAIGVSGIPSIAKNQASTETSASNQTSVSPPSDPIYATKEEAEKSLNLFLFGESAEATISVVADISATPFLESLKIAAEGVLKDVGWTLKSFRLNGTSFDSEHNQAGN